jgi:hypothetical protein
VLIKGGAFHVAAAAAGDRPGQRLTDSDRFLVCAGERQRTAWLSQEGNRAYRDRAERAEYERRHAVAAQICYSNLDEARQQSG